MKRFARTGETADPCGVPLVRCASVPSACCSDAASHRLTYSSTHRSVQTAVSALTTRSHETVSKNFRRAAVSRAGPLAAASSTRDHPPGIVLVIDDLEPL